MSDQPRDIRVTMTRDEFVALQSTVTGELESLTTHDWESGIYDDLDQAQAALNRAWHRYGRRQGRVSVVSVRGC